MAILQPIIDLVEICAKRGIKRVILCPGSRSAAVTLAFARNPKITCYSISDERSAGFIALGMALQTKEVVAIVCTSGSAVYNFAPAVVEAFFQEIPLLVFSADRPSEWIHQNDGQTIYQQNIFGQNVKKSYQLLADYNHADTAWFINRTINEAISNCNELPFGPVHINIPIREPFYPAENEVFKPSINLSALENIPCIFEISESSKLKLISEFLMANNVLIAVGQHDWDDDLNYYLTLLNKEYGIPILYDVISNVKVPQFQNHDHIFNADNESVMPDLLITFGKSFISKSFKKYFQKNKVAAHWHIQIGNKIIDPLQSITKIIPLKAADFLKIIWESAALQDIKELQIDKSNHYFQKWENQQWNIEDKKIKFLKNQIIFSELLAYKTVIDLLPIDCELHLANSMAVRYVNMLSLSINNKINVFANRGTSGIDGCLSTAVGSAMLTDKLTISFIGDVAFFYDRNALWNNYLHANLRIIVFNNNGGGIFRLIDGPSQQPELNEFFETKQNLTAKSTAEEAGLSYFAVSNQQDLEKILPIFLLNNGKAKCLEITTSGEINQAVFKAFKAEVKI
jgi:2-succinyl-5-enolpyruvyl-6-hydroxy-3-cyclohexene-1-carboxylate synthase